MSSHQPARESVPVPEDVLAELLSSPRRRLLISQLAAMDGEAVAGDLAAAVSARERGCEPSEVADSTRREVREEVFERDIPKLAATGIVEYDSMLDRIRLEAPELAAHLEENPDAEPEGVSKEK